MKEISICCSISDQEFIDSVLSYWGNDTEFRVRKGINGEQIMLALVAVSTAAQLIDFFLTHIKSEDEDKPVTKETSEPSRKRFIRTAGGDVLIEGDFSKDEVVAIMEELMK